MNESATVPAEPLHQHRNFISTVFHDLSQPLTALQCSLELALLNDPTLEELRQSVEAALQNAERLAQRLVLLRQLSDAEDPGDTSAPLALDRLLHQLREDVLPLFESAAQTVEVICDPVQVYASETRLVRGFFYLLEFLLRRYPQSGVLRLRAKRCEDEIFIEVARAAAGMAVDTPGDSLVADYSAQLEIARRTFQAVGGNLEWRSLPGHPDSCLVRLPCAG